MKKKFLIFSIFLSFFIHFKNPSEIFYRSLLNYDDKQFIAPLETINISDYQEKWLFQKNNYAFPLRDLTFYFDFFIKNMTGFSFFCFFNWIFFVLGMFFLLKIFQIVFKSDSEKDLKPELLWSWIFFHPTHVEMIQWVSNRKHVLVLLFINIGTYLTLKLKENLIKNLKNKKDTLNFHKKYFVLIFLCYFLSLFCWPSGLLWIFFPFFILIPYISFEKRMMIGFFLCLFSFVFLTKYISFLANYNENYNSQSINFIFDLHKMKIALDIFYSSLGRGIFTVLFPIQMEPYYHIKNIYNNIGIFILFFSFLLYFFLFTKSKLDKKIDSIKFLFLGFLLFFPLGKVFFNPIEFTWADRYAFFILPYFFISFAILIPFKISSRFFKTFYVFLISFFLYHSFKSLPRWIFDGDLFEKCSLEEESFKCLFFAVEKKYDKEGCKNLENLFILSRKKSLEEKSKKDLSFFSFENQLPFYESLCIAASQISFEEKKQNIENLRLSYEEPFFQTFGEIIFLLSFQKLDEALLLAKERYLNGRMNIPDTSDKMINVISGQIDLLCTLENLLNKNILNCKENLSTFTNRVGGFNFVEKQKMWGFQKSMNAYNDGKK